MRRSIIYVLTAIVLLAVVAVLAVTTPNFLMLRTVGTILALASIVGVLAVGQAFALIGGGFDLSQGAMLALTAAVTASAVVDHGLAAPAACAVALGAGLLLGTINGLCVAYIGTNPFVTTLSSMLVYRGAAFVFLGGQSISGVTAFGTIDPIRGVVFLGMTAVAWFVLRGTVFGQYVYAVGWNAEAARLAGVRTRRVRAATFALSGLASGAAAILLLSWVRLAKPETGIGYEFDAIAACVVGGISLQGGSGSVLGAAAGCLLLQSLGTWITMSGFPDEYRSLVTGAVILFFAALDAITRRSSGRRSA